MEAARTRLLLRPHVRARKQHSPATGSAAGGKGTSLQAAPWRLSRLSLSSESPERARPHCPSSQSTGLGGAPQGIHGGEGSDGRAAASTPRVPDIHAGGARWAVCAGLCGR